MISKKDNLPGEGIGWFLTKTENFSKLSKYEKLKIVNGELARIYAYPYWNEVLDAVDLSPTQTSSTENNSAAASSAGFGGGESKEHRKLKIFISKNPSIIKLRRKAGKGKTEAGLPSGDRMDVEFKFDQEWIAVEVKSSRSPKEDIIRGLYQCVKYQAVMRAVQSTEDRERNARALLVLGGKFPKNLLSMRNTLGVTVFDQIEERFN